MERIPFVEHLGLAPQQTDESQDVMSFALGFLHEYQLLGDAVLNAPHRPSCGLVVVILDEGRRLEPSAYRTVRSHDQIVAGEVADVFRLAAVDGVTECEIQTYGTTSMIDPKLDV